MWFISGICFAFILLIVAAWILPWINRNRILSLHEEIEQIKERLRLIEYKSRQAAAQTTKEAPHADSAAKDAPPAAEKLAPFVPPASPVPPMAANISTPRLTSVPTAKETDAENLEWEMDDPAPAQTVSPRKAAAASKTPAPSQAAAPVRGESGFELQFGAKLPVWFGGIALAFAGFYLVKYSIDIGLLTPAVRTVIGAIFGLGLLAAGKTIRTKESIANGTRIAQALTGAGIADLYVCIFAAANLYSLIQPVTGFICMGVVTAAAVILSLRHGAPIALLGMVGGFLTPALMGGQQPSALLLFGYLYFVLAGLMFIIRRQGWWFMGYLAMAAAFLWAAIWLIEGYFGPYDGLWLGIFLIACCATLLGNPAPPCASSANSGNPALRTAPRALQITGFIGALILMGCTVTKAEFGLMEWGLFGLLAAGGMALAWFRMEQYRFIPYASLAVNVLMLWLWHVADKSSSHALVLGLFAALYALGSYLLQWKTARPFYWATLCVTASFTFFLLGYDRLHHVYQIPHLWSVIALGLAAVATHMTWRVYESFQPDHPERNKMLALYAGAASGFIALGLVIDIPYEFLSVALAFELLALSWIQTRVDIPALRRIIACVAIVFAVPLFPQMVALVQISSWALLEQRFYAEHGLPLVNWPLFQLGLPAVCFLLSAILLRRKDDTRMVRVFEVVSITLLGLAGYYLTRHILHPGQNILFVTAGFGERGIITNVLFVFGLSCLALGRRFDRSAVIASGITLCCLAFFRLGYFDLLLHNPLWNSNQHVGEMPVLNWLLVTFGLPMALSAALVRLALPLQAVKTAHTGRIAMFILAFALMTFEVRQYFHGAVLAGGTVPDAEIYAYSAVWLLFGLLLLFYGVLRKLPLVRKASLAVVILVVGKVFLYDASELTGLYRVAAFFGLGVSLLGISWFYSRFVFPKPAGDRD